MKLTIEIEFGITSNVSGWLIYYSSNLTGSCIFDDIEFDTKEQAENFISFLKTEINTFYMPADSLQEVAEKCYARYTY